MSVTVKAIFFQTSTRAVESFPAVMRQTTSLTGRTTTEGMALSLLPNGDDNAHACEDTPANRARLALAGVTYVVGKCIIDRADYPTLAPEAHGREMDRSARLREWAIQRDGMEYKLAAAEMKLRSAGIEMPE